MRSVFQDDARRLRGAVVASFLINAALWGAAGGAILGKKSPPPPTIEISRIVISKKGEKTPKIVTKKQIERKVQRIQRQIVRRPPIRPTPPEIREKRALESPRRARPRQPSLAKPRPRAPQSNRPITRPQNPRPEGARNRTLVAKNRAAPGAGLVKNGGNADLGKPLDNQNFGAAKTNPKNYVAPDPQPQPTESPAPQAAPPAPPVEPTPKPRPEPTSTPRPTPTPRPEPTPTPRPEPTPTPRPRPTPTPQPRPTPRPSGPTREARATRQVQPTIPDELKSGEFKSSVRVRVEISADGSPSPSLRGSSGNAAIDSRVLAALQRWRWKPALKDGQPVASTQFFRFDFEVR